MSNGLCFFLCIAFVFATANPLLFEKKECLFHHFLRKSNRICQIKLLFIAFDFALFVVLLLPIIISSILVYDYSKEIGTVKSSRLFSLLTSLSPDRIHIWPKVHKFNRKPLEELHFIATESTQNDRWKFQLFEENKNQSPNLFETNCGNDTNVKISKSSKV